MDFHVHGSDPATFPNTSLPCPHYFGCDQVLLSLLIADKFLSSTKLLFVLLITDPVNVVKSFHAVYHTSSQKNSDSAKMFGWVFCKYANV